MAGSVTGRIVRGKAAGRMAWAFMAAVIISMALHQAAIAAPAPVPSPNPYNAYLIDAVPGLEDLSAPDWLSTGYRLFYDVYYYDAEDKVMGMELLMVDVKARGEGYVLSSSTTAGLDEDGTLMSLVEGDYIIDFAGIGEAWISPYALSDAKAPAAESGLFKLGIFENMVQFDEDGRAWFVTVDVADAEKGSTTADIYYDRKTGLALLFDIYVYGPEGGYIGGAAIQYRDYAIYEAPWAGLGFTALKEGTILDYGLRMEHSDGSVEIGRASFTILENHGGWLKVLEQRHIEGAKTAERTVIVSGFSLDGLLLSLPGGSTKGLQDGFTYFYDDYTAAKVTAKGPVTLEGAGGEAYEIVFSDGLTESWAVFRAEDGLMVRYVKQASPVEPYKTILVYNGSR